MSSNKSSSITLQKGTHYLQNITWWISSSAMVLQRSLIEQLYLITVTAISNKMLLVCVREVWQP